ncbi:riboflavin synthase [Spongorhabdus nitratireducens]
MFTGIIEAVGTIRALENRGGDVRLDIQAGTLDMSDVKLGDSIATNGVCLTAVVLSHDSFVADVSRETLNRTGLAALKPGSSVNLEKAMRANGRLDGHIVSGHVDGVGKILSIEPSARSMRYRVEAPTKLAHYIAEKGSITIDGVSLTVNAVEGAVFEVNIVPHTAEQTIIHHYRPGSRVNLEVDIIARYLERLLHGRMADNEDDHTPESKLTESFLTSHGFTGRRR